MTFLQFGSDGTRFYIEACLVTQTTYSTPSGKRIRSVTCSYSTPSTCFGPSMNGTLSTYPPPDRRRTKFLASEFQPMVKGYFQPPNMGYRGLISRRASRLLVRNRDVDTLPITSV